MLKLEFHVLQYVSSCVGPSRISSHSFVSEEQKHEYKPLIKLNGYEYSNGSLEALVFVSNNKTRGSFNSAVLGLSRKVLL